MQRTFDLHIWQHVAYFCDGPKSSYLLLETSKTTAQAIEIEYKQKEKGLHAKIIPFRRTENMTRFQRDKWDYFLYNKIKVYYLR